MFGKDGKPILDPRQLLADQDGRAPDALLKALGEEIDENRDESREQALARMREELAVDKVKQK